jgi:hypothetical protein
MADVHFFQRAVRGAMEYMADISNLELGEGELDALVESLRTF